MGCCRSPAVKVSWERWIWASSVRYGVSKRVATVAVDFPTMMKMQYSQCSQLILSDARFVLVKSWLTTSLGIVVATRNCHVVIATRPSTARLPRNGTPQGYDFRS